MVMAVGTLKFLFSFSIERIDSDVTYVKSGI